MTVMLKRQLNDEEKKEILRVHGRKCFATGHEIPEGEPIHFDHIRAFALDGATDLTNIAPMCAQHNREKSTLSLFDFRVKLRLQEFFATGDRLTLKSLLAYMQTKGDVSGFGQPIAVHDNGNTVAIESPAKKWTCDIYTCPTTGWKYFYGMLDVTVIDSDDDHDAGIGLQPRYLIFEKVFGLFRHFQQHPVLQPSLGRIVNNRIRLFDGQHKLAALLWNGRRTLECKVYLSHDARLLNQTNIAAHDKFAQTRFFSSIMVLKLGSQFGADFENYKNLEDGHVKSEAGFIDYLSQKESGTLTQAELNARFRNYLYNAVLQHEDNLLSKYVSTVNRSTAEKPFTIDLLSKSLFACFLYREPTADNMTMDGYKRDAELHNMVALMNMLHDVGLHNWNAKAGTNDETQRKLNRIVRSKAMMAWSEILRDAVLAKLDISDGDDRIRPFYRALTDAELAKVKEIVGRLLNWKMWSAPTTDDIDRVLSDNKSEVKSWLKDKKLTTGYLMGAPE